MPLIIIVKHKNVGAVIITAIQLKCYYVICTAKSILKLDWQLEQQHTGVKSRQNWLPSGNDMWSGDNVDSHYTFKFTVAHHMMSQVNKQKQIVVLCLHAILVCKRILII